MARPLKRDVDQRALNMPFSVLVCRKLGHAWQEVPLGKKRRVALRGTGQTEEMFKCLRSKCGLVRVDVIDESTWDVVGRSNPHGYPEGYLVPRGTGRLSRTEARKAYAVRRSPT
jgi:hypothetical protein